MIALEQLPQLYDRLNGTSFGGRLRPALIRVVPWILSMNTPGARLAGAWFAEDWSIGIDGALLNYPKHLFGTLLHEMTQQACHQTWGVDGHGPLFVNVAAIAGAQFGIPGPTPATASTWPYPVPRHLLKEI